jgi:CBS domain-containing membrane protein
MRSAEEVLTSCEERTAAAGIAGWLGIETIAISRREKLAAALGGGFAILALTALSLWAESGAVAGAVVASMGASAVLLFAVPHGQLSQPWPVIGGHTVSAAIGVTCALLVPSPALAAGIAVGLSIAAMAELRCIHPPGGATAFVAVIGGSTIHDQGYRFVLVPVLANALFMVVVAVVLDAAFRRRRYPAGAYRSSGTLTAGSPASQRPTHEEIVAAVRSLDSFVDVTDDDIVRLANLLS